MVISIAEGMKKLTDDIVSSADFRLKAVGNIVADTQNTLKGFTAGRKRMSQQQAKGLADFTNGLSKDVQNLLKQAQDMVNHFHKTNRQMGMEQAKNLADFAGKLNKDVSSMLTGFEKDRGRMSKELRNKLAMEIEDIHTQVERILDQTDKLVGEYKSDIIRAKKAWKDMSTTTSRARKKCLATPKLRVGRKAANAPKAIGRNKKKTLT